MHQAFPPLTITVSNRICSSTGDNGTGLGGHVAERIIGYVLKHGRVATRHIDPSVEHEHERRGINPLWFSSGFEANGVGKFRLGTV